jgi:MFS family permease
MLQPLIPSVAHGLHTTVGYVAGAITAYMIPFASLQLVSGTIAERVGGGRLVRAGYLSFGLASVLAAAAPDIWTFIGARAVTGAANAFLTPILMAALSEVVAPPVLGRAIGTFAAVQVAGLTLAPALGGALGEVSWRLGFVLVAIVGFALTLGRVELRRPEADQPRASLRSLVDRRIALMAGKAMTGYLGFTSIGFLVTLVCSRLFGLGPGLTGLVIASYGVGGMLFGRVGGVTADRLGRPATALLGVVACGAGVLGLVFASSAWSFSIVYFAVGCGSAFAWAALNTIAVESFTENRAGAISAYSAFKFAGVAVAPLIYLPLFDADIRSPFIAATGFTAVCALLVLPWFRAYRSAPASAERV